jgi:hypothetical protein
MAEAFTEQTIVKLRGVYKSIKDGMAAGSSILISPLSQKRKSLNSLMNQMKNRVIWSR